MPLPADGAALTATVTAEGVLPATELTTGDHLCNGLVSPKPDLMFSVGDGLDGVSVFFEGSADTALLVRGPDDAAFCADDIDDGANLNPSIALDQPALGDYLVWVGRIGMSGKPVTMAVPLAQGTHYLVVQYRQYSGTAYVYVTWAYSSNGTAYPTPPVYPVQPTVTPASTPVACDPSWTCTCPTQATTVTTQYGDYTSCIQQSLPQSACFVSDGQWDAPNA